MGCKSFGDYHVYLKIDVFQLLDVFEKFRDVCKLDPACFCRAPNLGYDAGVVELGLPVATENPKTQRIRWKKLIF